MKEVSSLHQNLEEEQISKMIETAKLLLGEMRKRNEKLGEVEKSCDLLSEELRKARRQVEEMNGRLHSLIDSMKDCKEEEEEDVKPPPLPNILNFDGSLNEVWVQQSN